MQVRHLPGIKRAEIFIGKLECFSFLQIGSLTFQKSVHRNVKKKWLTAATDKLVTGRMNSNQTKAGY